MSQGTEFFEYVVEDPNIPGIQLVIFFIEAHREQEGRPDEQLRLLDLLKKHRPELEKDASYYIIHGL